MIAAVAVVGIPVVVVALLFASCDSKENPARYAAWIKATGNTNVTFGEWLTLKNDYLLPGQSKPSSTYVVPIYTGR